MNPPPLEELLGFQSETPVSDEIGLTMQQVFMVFLFLYLFDTMTVQMGKSLLERNIGEVEDRIKKIEEHIEQEDN